MMEIILSSFIYVLIILVIVFWRRRVDVVHLLTLALAGFFILYAVISMCLFCAGVFSIRRCLWVELAAAAVVTVLFMISAGRRRTAEQERAQIHAASLVQNWPVYLLIAILALATQGHFGFFGMGQDQGVYQTEAINLYYDHDDWRQTITDFDGIEDEEYKAYCAELIRNSLGFNLTEGEKTLQRLGLLHMDASLEQENQSSTEASSTGSSPLLDGIWHGLPPYAALLGLSARIHGISGMMQIGTTFYILMLLLFAFVLQTQNIAQAESCLLTFLLGICPQLIWQKKSSLTEGFTAMLILLYIYLILQEDGKLQALSVLPIVAFAVTHVSIYVILPVLLLNYWVLYWRTGHRRHLCCAAVTAGGYLAAFLMSVSLQPIYTIRKNYYNPLKRFLHMNWIIPVFVGCALAAAAVSAALPVVRCWAGKKAGRRMAARTDPVKAAATGAGEGIDIDKRFAQATSRAFLWLSRSAAALTVVTVLYQIMIRHTPITQLTIYCYWLLSGLFPLPMVCWRICRGNASARDGCKENSSFTTAQLLAGNLFLWMILLFSIFMRPRSAYYYYYTRYLAPYISIILVNFALFFCRRREGNDALAKLPAQENPVEPALVKQPSREAIEKSPHAKPSAMKNARRQCTFLPAVLRCAGLAAGILFLLPWTFVVVRNQDDTIMQWSAVTQILDQVEKGDIVYLNPEEMLTMYHPLRAKGAKVYPVKDDLETTMAIVENSRSNVGNRLQADGTSAGTSVLYLTNSMLDSSDQREVAGTHFVVVYANETTYQEDDNTADAAFTNMPTDIPRRGSRQLILYQAE